MILDDIAYNKFANGEITLGEYIKYQNRDKIMDYEKKYKEALERAKEFVSKDVVESLEYIFPELIESEDEKIRKAIIAYIDHGQHNGVSNKDMIAWLEKQSEKNVNHIGIKEKAHQIAWETSKDYDPLLSKESWCEMAALDMASWLEKQGDINETSAEWSEEDKQMILSIEQVMNCASLLNLVPEKIDNIKSWLKSLRPQKQWKPTEKQGESTITNIEIPFGANDSELQEVTYYIPKGFHAEIEDDKVVIKKDEKSTARR